MPTLFETLRAHVPLKRPFERCRWSCERTDVPGIDESEEWRDWAGQPTTPDQLRIEAEFDRMDIDGARVLHVGVGNSRFAEHFAPRVAAIDGLTIQEPEKHLADRLGIDNYRVFLFNKYSPRYPEELPQAGYDFILDNNPSRYACCRLHFGNMMDNYSRLLGDGGRILTDAVGLGRLVNGADPRWSLSFTDWVRLGVKHRLRAGRVTESVFALEKPGGRRRSAR